MDIKVNLQKGGGVFDLELWCFDVLNNDQVE